MALHVRYAFRYLSLPFSEKQHDMTTFNVVLDDVNTRSEFSFLCLTQSSFRKREVTFEVTSLLSSPWLLNCQLSFELPTLCAIENCGNDVWFTLTSQDGKRSFQMERVVFFRKLCLTGEYTLVQILLFVLLGAKFTLVSRVIMRTKIVSTETT